MNPQLQTISKEHARQLAAFVKHFRHIWQEAEKAKDRLGSVDANPPHWYDLCQIASMADKGENSLHHLLQDIFGLDYAQRVESPFSEFGIGIQ